MLTKIILSQVASYKSPAIVETDKKINLIYGLNGTGKSTFSNYLMNLSDSKFRHCTVEGLSDKHELMVYSQAFVKDNFFEPDGLKGIFTLSKENKDAEIRISNAKSEIQRLNSEREKETELVEKERSDINQKLIRSENIVWKIKTDFSGGDRVFEFCLKSYMGSKNRLFTHLGNLSVPTEEPSKSTQDLNTELESISGDNSQRYHLLPSMSFSASYIESDNLFEKEIIGNNNTTISELINKLGNSDWVKEGLDYLTYDKNQENEKCPFCQEKTISEYLIKNIKDYFDASYEEDVVSLNSFLIKYRNTRQSIQEKSIFEKNPKYEAFKKDFETKYESLTKILDENIRLIENKIKAPSKSILLNNSDGMLNELNTVILKINALVIEHNNKIDKKEVVILNIKKYFWNIMRWDYDQTINLYSMDKSKSVKKLSLLESSLRGLGEQIKDQEAIILEQQKKTVNIEEAIVNINNSLIDLGATDFRISNYSNNLYKIIRDESDESVFHSLSEGEKMIISFLYFIELCKGKAEGDGVNKKIIVIDDPISSLSHIYIFNIGRLIKNEFFGRKVQIKDELTGENVTQWQYQYEQVFILTHSLYFFYEITETNHEVRKASQKLIRLLKNENGSSFKKLSYEEIQNDYQAYWYIINDDTQPPALIANCMRNIIEYFFNFVEKKDLNNFFLQEPLRNNRYQAFYRYINRESHSLGQNIFDYKEFDYENFKSGFSELFKITGYENHYKK